MMYNLFVSDLHTVLFTYSAVVFLSWKLVSTSPLNKTDTSVPHLERYCNTEPLIINNGRYGGSFILSDYLEQFCTVTLMIVTPSAIPGTCSVYFNIAESTMPENDELKVYQHGSGSLLKVIRNDVDNSVASVGQFQTTDFRHNITLTLNLIRQKETINRSHQIKFQYTLVIYQPVGIYSKSWIRCRALRGYVLRRLACDGKINRFTCPIELNTAVNGNNAVKYHDVRACTGQLHIILEFSSHGSLLKYLRLHDKLFQEKTSETSYLNEGMASFTMDGRESSIPKEWPLKTADLINFTYQVSRGMEYLAVHDIIHRDLAARNVLVCDNKVLKICDFGLARQKPDYYRMTESQDARVPARWMAPESYEQRLFSERSDVWSFGVVTWEIFSYGGIPYHDTIKDLACQDITAALRNGLRLKIPLKCPKAVDDIMRECWEYEAAKRPTFSVLRQRIECHVGKDAQCEYIDLNKQYVMFNIKHAEDYIAVESGA